jgi:hypothetical protein
MKNGKKMMAILFMCALMALGVNVLAKGETVSTSPVQAVTGYTAALTSDSPNVARIGVFVSSFLAGDVHEQTYLTYLIKDYSPESLSAWQEAFEARNQAVKEVEKRLPQPEITKDDNATQLPLISKVFSIAVNKGNNSSAPESGFQVESSTNGKDFVFTKSAPIDPAVEEQFKARADLMADFTKAVEAKDGDSIKALLPKLLDDYQKRTKEMSELPVPELKN